MTTYVHVALGLLGYWLGSRTLLRFLRWRLTRAARRWEWRESLHEISEARAEVESWATEHLNVLDRARECRSCWNESPPGVQSAVGAPSMYALCRSHKQGRAHKFYGGCDSCMGTGQVRSLTTAFPYHEKASPCPRCRPTEMDYEEYLKYLKGLPSKYVISGRTRRAEGI